ncbi:MAG TPA: ArdC-like ssDNA-binding domain-containing protein [Acidimicrobiales bacterium]|jgi:antirestriction protein ArdC|nr:ArdC-like ssDNA-binding domain-containing protein [Acidimicrobiales bacterium]
MTVAKATDRTDRLHELQEQLEQQVAELVSGEDWARMLETASRFHRYSANNVMLIMAQMSTASRVAGFNTWKQLGRSVRKGEHAIRILAPCKYKVETDDGDPRWILRGFTTACVFDISQTEGADIPDIRPVLLAGEAPAGLWDALAKQVATAGFTLDRGDCGGANGVTNYATRTVTVRADVDDAQACKTLAHELAHVLLHDRTDSAWSLCMEPGSRRLAEIEAESVAYIVCHAQGLATGAYSLPYVASWSRGDIQTVRRTAETVCKAAGVILAGLDTAEAATAALVAV